MAKIVAVFGSARIQTGNPVYQASYDVGRVLAGAGFITMTGGYAGVMEAASKGAAEAGGHVVGATVASLEYIGESRTNQWVEREVRFDTLDQRVAYLVRTADACVVMPGGIGTVQELVDVWQKMRLGDLPEKPLLLYGDFWLPMINSMLDAGFVDDRETRLLTQVDSPEATITILQRWFGEQQES